MKKEEKQVPKLAKAAIIVDLWTFLRIARAVTWIAHKTNKHKHKQMIFLLSATEIALITQCGNWLLIDARSKLDLYLISLLFILFTAMVVHKLAYHMKKSAAYDPIWAERDNPEHARLGQEYAMIDLLTHIKLRMVWVPLMHMLVSWYIAVSLAGMVIGDIGHCINLVLFVFWFSALYLDIYINAICDIKPPPKKKSRSKQKAKQALTNLQQKVWDKLVGNLVPAPSPC